MTEPRSENPYDPHALQQELSILYGLFPQSTLPTSLEGIISSIRASGITDPDMFTDEVDRQLNEISTDQLRRARSEHKQVVIRGIKKLVAIAVNDLRTITPSFGAFIANDLANYYDLGITKPDAYPGRLELDLEDTQSGGIFDSVRAKELEKAAFRQQVALYVKSEEIIHGVFGGEQFTTDPSGIIPLFQDWRQEFFDKHKDEL